jgi:hypothetical protein
MPVQKQLLGAGAGAVDDSRSYMPERPDRERELFDDVAWYEGRYPSQLGETAGGGATAQGRRRLGPRASQRTAAPASDTGVCVCVCAVWCIMLCGHDVMLCEHDFAVILLLFRLSVPG